MNRPLIQRALLILAAAGVAAASSWFLFPGFFYDLSISRYRSAANLSVHRAQVDDHLVAWLEGGAGEPVVMLHGFGGDKDHWNMMAAALTGNYRVIAPDLPGFGESSKLAGALYTTAAQVERIARFAESAGLRRFHLAGSSMGGAIAGRFAATYPDRVLSLALFAPGGVTTAEPSEHALLVKQGTNRLLAASADEFRDLLAFIFVEPPPVPGSILRYLADRSVKSRAFNAGIYTSYGNEGYSLERDGSRIAAPVLVVWGDTDRVLHRSGAAVLQREIPGSRVVIMNRCGHLPMVERPEEAAAHYRLFLAGVASPVSR